MNKRPLNPITDEHRAAYARDGVVCLRQMFDREWIAGLQQAAADVVANPKEWGNTGPSQGPMTSVSFMWRRPGIFREFALNGPAGELIGEVMGAETIQLFHDHLFHKQPLSAHVFPWHPDHMWPFEGTMVANLWTALSPVNAENGRIEFLAGYHRHCIDNKLRYGPAGGGRPFPDFAAEIAKPDCPFKVISWDLEPGDAVLFQVDTPHYSKGNDSKTQARTGLAMRVIGDDVTWCPVAGLAPVPGLDYMAMTRGTHPEPSEQLPLIWSRRLGASRAA